MKTKLLLIGLVLDLLFITVSTQLLFVKNDTLINKIKMSANQAVKQIEKITTKKKLLSSSSTAAVPSTLFPSNIPIVKTEIKSENYPNPYPGNKKFEWSAIVEGGTGITINIESLDLDPTRDFLFIRGGDKDTIDEKGIIQTGNIVSTGKIRIIHTNHLYIEFISNQVDISHSFKGFLLTYEPYIPSIISTEPPITESPNNNFDIEYLTKSVVVPINKQIEKTWGIFKNIISVATNEFIKAENITTHEKSTFENVIFKSVKNCPETWRDHETCIQFDFAVPLKVIETRRKIINESLDGYELHKILQEEPKYELTAENLVLMWDRFARKRFHENSFDQYSNETSDLLLIWILISVGTVVIFLLVLYVIYKTDVLQEYRKMAIAKDDRIENERKSSNVDISNYPTQYQTLPNLFPSTDGYFSTPTYNFESNMYDNKIYANDDLKSDEPVDYDSYHKRVVFDPEVENYSSGSFRGRENSFQADESLEIPNPPKRPNLPHYIKNTSDASEL